MCMKLLAEADGHVLPFVDIGRWDTALSAVSGHIISTGNAGQMHACTESTV